MRGIAHKSAVSYARDYARDEEGSGLSKIRPYFGPRQIRTLRGLHLGQTIIEFQEGYGARNLFVVKEILPKEGVISVVEIDANSCSLHTSRRYLSDHSVTSYDKCDDGSVLWNNWWCFLRTRAKTAKGLCRTKQKSLIRLPWLSWVQDIDLSKATTVISEQNAKIKRGEIKVPRWSQYEMGLSRSGKENTVGIYFFDPTAKKF